MDESLSQHSICDEHCCIPFQVDKYNEARDKDGAQLLIEGSTDLCPEQKKLAFLDQFFCKKVYKIIKPETEQQESIVNEEFPIICKCYADVVRLQGIIVGIICYGSAEITKMDYKSGGLNLICSTKEYEKEIISLLINRAVDCLEQDNVQAIAACAPETTTVICNGLEEKQFRYVATIQKLKTYRRDTSVGNKKRQLIAAVEEKQDQSPFITYLTKNNIEQVFKLRQPTILNVFSHICPACRQMTPIFKELAEAYSGIITFAKIQYEANSEFINQMMREHSLKSIPAFFFIQDDKIVDVITGYKSKDALKEKIASVFNK